MNKGSNDKIIDSFYKIHQLVLSNLLKYIKDYIYNDSISINDIEKLITIQYILILAVPRINRFSSGILRQLKLIFTICLKDQIFINRSLLVFKLLINTAKKSSYLLKSLLLEADEYGFTPLNLACMSNEIKILDIYFQELDKAIEEQIISRSDYNKLLIAVNKDRYTLLHIILISGQTDILVLCLEKLRKALYENIIEIYQYKKVLIAYNNSSFTPLHEALISGNIKNLEIYLQALLVAIKDGIISKEEYKNLLISPNIDGITPLQEAANGDNLEVLKYFVTILKKELNDNEFKQALYAAKYNDVIPHGRIKNNIYTIIIKEFLDDLPKKNIKTLRIY